MPTKARSLTRATTLRSATRPTTSLIATERRTVRLRMTLAQISSTAQIATLGRSSHKSGEILANKEIHVLNLGTNIKDDVQVNINASADTDLEACNNGLSAA
jgi:hypothetical protein